MKKYSDFEFNATFQDGRTLRINMPKCSVAEWLICRKLSSTMMLSLFELVELRKRQEISELVEKIIKDCMEKLKCKNKKY